MYLRTLSPAAYIIRGKYYCLLYDLLEKYLAPLFMASFTSGAVVVLHSTRYCPTVSPPPSDHPTALISILISNLVSTVIFYETVTTYIFLESNFSVEILNIADVNFETRR
jgi:membrane-bound acyltransferase YfiQ involved in biofilm formation